MSDSNPTGSGGFFAGSRRSAPAQLSVPGNAQPSHHTSFTACSFTTYGTLRATLGTARPIVTLRYGSHAAGCHGCCKDPLGGAYAACKRVTKHAATQACSVCPRRSGWVGSALPDVAADPYAHRSSESHSCMRFGPRARRLLNARLRVAGDNPVVAGAATGACASTPACSGTASQQHLVRPAPS